METQLTAPFGGRSLTYAHLQTAARAAQRDTTIRINKWKLFADIRQARKALGLGDRSLAVLSALLSFFPEADLGGTNLIVFPSNETLIRRANGIAPATLRRHLAALTDAGLVLRRDSPNGKRYARTNSEGQITTAFGFDLSPLVMRASELQTAARAAAAREAENRALREKITLLRREIGKLLDLIRAEPAFDGEALAHVAEHLNAAGSVPARNADSDQLRLHATQLEAVHDYVHNLLNNMIFQEKLSGYESHYEQHIQDSESQFLSESEDSLTQPSSGIMPTERSDVPSERPAPTGEDTQKHKPISLPHLSLVLKACPQAAALAPNALRSHNDLIKASEKFCSLLDIHVTALQKARLVMGPAQAAITIAGILTRADEIRSPGGYLRTLTSRAEKGTYSTLPMLSALLNKHKDMNP